MNNSESVNEPLKTLLSRLYNIEDMKIQLDDGSIQTATFTFNVGADSRDIEAIESKYGIKLPEDYVSFLRLHNGAKLFDLGHGDSKHIYSLAEVDADATLYSPDISPELFPIGAYLGNTIYIDTSREDLYLFKGGSSHEFDFLGMNFTSWLIYLIMANGQPFWEWSPSCFYRTVDDRELTAQDYSGI
ncbi:SMI1/KNR4 family protein [Paenibacillus amylolyticus]|uniref:SMI1/KNR4 family protein n=1 Tax=Paenibacillus amylolyticus TaxID=1451 RepID=UPI003EBC6D0E